MKNVTNKRVSTGNDLSANDVWQAIENQIFATVGMVTARNEARTAGVVYIVHHHKIYFSSNKTAWKTKHILQNPHVSMTVIVPRGIVFLPWLKIPPTTITFSGTARAMEFTDAPAERIIRRLSSGKNNSDSAVIFEVDLKGNFVTYGLGVSLFGMSDPVKAENVIKINEHS